MFRAVSIGTACPSMLLLVQGRVTDVCVGLRRRETDKKQSMNRVLLSGSRKGFIGINRWLHDGGAWHGEKR